MKFDTSRMNRHQQGVTLIELMIALVLGLFLVGGVIAVVVANGQAYRTNEGLSQVQESARTAFELLSRDIREAGATGCGNTDRIANTLNNGGLWWQEAWTGVRGYADGAAVPLGSDAPARVAGDALLIQGIAGTGVTITDHQATSAVFFINATTTDFASDDIVMACDFDHAAIFQISNYNSNNVTVGHNTGNNNPGNCSKGLGFPTECTTNGNEYTFGPNSQIARLSTTLWYIGNNGRPQEGGRSLYRRRLTDAAAQEIVPGVSDMQLQFRVGDNAGLTAPEAGPNWGNVTAVEVTLTMNSLDARVSTTPGVNDGRLQRTFTTIVGLRNRVE